MKKLKFIATLFMVAIMTMTSMELTYAFNKSQIPIYMEIGIYYEGTSKSTVHLKSNNGFEMGRFPNDEFISLLDILDKKDIILCKDSIEHQGGYHIQIGDTFNNKDEALDLLESLALLENRGYLVCEQGWKVFVGSYSSREDADKDIYIIQGIVNSDVKVISPSSTRIQVLDLTGRPLLMFDNEMDIYFRAIKRGNEVPLLNIDGKNYRGAITAKRLAKSDMSIVNKLLLEEYLYGVVPREMSPSWALEALKAQAVAARGTAVSGVNRFRSLGFDLCNSTRSQVYDGYNIEHPNSNRAVDETRDKLLTYNGEIVNAFYHSNSGGHTENSENIWSTPLPYIKGVKDDFSLNTVNSSWAEVLTKEQIKILLEKNNIFIGDLLDMKITSVSENGRVLELTVYGTKGKEILIKEKARTVFGLKSTYFTINGQTANNSIDENIMVKSNNDFIMPIELDSKFLITSSGIKKTYDNSNMNIYSGKNYRNEISSSPSPSSHNDTFVFNGKGWGHGLGMSQYGAKKMAEEGYNYMQILKHYYTGTKVE